MGKAANTRDVSDAAIASGMTRWGADASVGEVLYEEDRRDRVRRMVDTADDRVLCLVDRLLQLTQP